MIIILLHSPMTVFVLAAIAELSSSTNLLYLDLFVGLFLSLNLELDEDQVVYVLIISCI